MASYEPTHFVWAHGSRGTDVACARAMVRDNVALPAALAFLGAIQSLRLEEFAVRDLFVGDGLSLRFAPPPPPPPPRRHEGCDKAVLSRPGGTECSCTSNPRCHTLVVAQVGEFGTLLRTCTFCVYRRTGNCSASPQLMRHTAGGRLKRSYPPQCPGPTSATATRPRGTATRAAEPAQGAQLGDRLSGAPAAERVP